MILDSYIIGAYWGSRLESLDSIVEKTIKTVNQLKELDPYFSAWFELGMSLKQSNQSQITFSKESVKRLCLEKVKRGELDQNGYSKAGFLYSLWSGHQRPEESSKLTFNVGSEFHTNKLVNSCVLKLPSDGTNMERMVNPKESLEIVRLLVEIWSPDYAVLTSDKLRDLLDVGNRIGWVTYKKAAKSVSRSNKLVHRDLIDGSIVWAERNDYDDGTITDLADLKELWWGNVGGV